MSSARENFIKELAQREELENNIISWVFAYNPNIDISSKEDFFDNVRSYFEKFENEKPEIKFDREKDGYEEIMESWLGSDLRLKHIRFKSIKGYPQSSKPFGIDFESSGEPQSMIILGANASGKSSIFEVLEYVYCSEIGEVDLRNYEKGNEDRYKLYLEHDSEGVENIYGKIETVDKAFDVQNEINIPKEVRSVINPETHFISDHDIYTKGRLDYLGSSTGSFHDTIAQSLGFSEHLIFNKELKAFVKYDRRSETIKINRVKRNIRKQKKFLSESKESRKKLIERIKILQEDVGSTETQSDKQKNKDRIIQELTKVKKNIIGFSFDRKEYEGTRLDYIKVYNEYSSSTRRSISEGEIDFLQSGLNLINNFDDCPFCENSKLVKDDIINRVKKRIKDLEQKDDLRSKLNRLLEKLLNLLEDISSQILWLIHSINSETEELSKYPEFSDLFELQSYFENQVYEVISEEKLEEMTKLGTNKRYIENKSEDVYNFVQENSELVNVFSKLENIINEFISKKIKVVKRIESKIGGESKSIDKSKTEEIAELKVKLNKTNDQIKRTKDNLERDGHELNEYQQQKGLFERIQHETSKYQDVVSTVLNKKVNESFSPIKLIVEEILENYFQRQGRNIRIEITQIPDIIDDDSGEVLSEKIVAFIENEDDKNKRFRVKKHLNTFHYRLFLTMVGISIAVASRIKTGINLPLILDDVFYASDFENRASIEVFIKALFEAFNKFTDDKKLQLILFTHDQLLFDSANKVISELPYVQEDELVFAKLLPYKHSEEVKNFRNVVFKFEDNYRRKIIQREFSNV